MKTNLKKRTSKIFVFILLVSFIALPLKTTFCVISCGLDGHDNHSPIHHETEVNHFYNLQYSGLPDKDCEDSETSYFNIEQQKDIKNSPINYIPFSNTLLTDDNLLSEDKLSLKFIAYHFSPPQHNSNKLYKINSALLI